MEATLYSKYVRALKLGKQLPDAVYLHESAFESVPGQLIEFVNSVIDKLCLHNKPWNILKLSKQKYSFSLLNYPDFLKDPYPSLHESYTVNLTNLTCKKVSFLKSKNPPILHRKEVLISPHHPYFEEFTQITKEGELAGLYDSTASIGFRKNWEQAIAQKGYKLFNGILKPISHELDTKANTVHSSGSIDRHKTAIDRNSLSSPIQSLLRHSFLNGDYSLFDYGCGKGDDLNILNENGVNASGWDPVFYPDNKKQSADIVNLGFVINVIEKLNERSETVISAYKLSKKLLVVSAMLGGNSITEKFEKYGDGVKTTRNTFQKYYSQNELRDYLENVLQENAIAVGPGVFYIFRDKIEEQSFLINRQRQKNHWQKLSYADTPERLAIKQRALYERHKELFEQFWQTTLDLGRLPSNMEFAESDTLRSICSSHKKALQLLVTIHDETQLFTAERGRKNDLVVYYALSLFGKRKPYKHMPERLKRDIKHFFGNYSTAIEEATKHLFSVGKPEIINKHCLQAVSDLGRGNLIDNHSLTIHKNDIELLPIQLRIYIGCASQLYGDIDSIDLVKIHIQSGKVSLMRYDDFETKPLPLLLERVKIKLREQDIDFFEYGQKFKPQPLYLKSKYIVDSYPDYNKQVKFDKKLQQFDWLDLSNYGPSLEDLESELLKHENLKLEDF